MTALYLVLLALAFLEATWLFTGARFEACAPLCVRCGRTSRGLNFGSPPSSSFPSNEPAHLSARTRSAIRWPTVHQSTAGTNVSPEAHDMRDRIAERSRRPLSRGPRHHLFVTDKVAHRRPWARRIRLVPCAAAVRFHGRQRFTQCAPTP